MGILKLARAGAVALELGVTEGHRAMLLNGEDDANARFSCTLLA
jgi:hypothetical protein